MKWIFLIICLLKLQSSFCQCEFGERYSDRYLNLKPLDSIGKVCLLHKLTSGKLSEYKLTKIKRDDIYHFKENVGYKSTVSVKFQDSLVTHYKYLYNSGSWGSKGKVACYYQYYANGNLQFSALIRGKGGSVMVYDTLTTQECDVSKLPRIKGFRLIRVFRKIYFLDSKYNEINLNLFMRWRLILGNKEILTTKIKGHELKLSREQINILIKASYR